MASALEITFRETGADKFEFLLKDANPVNVGDARSLISIAARSTCQGRPVVLGAFNVTPQPASFQFVQQVSCGSAAPAAAATGPALTAEQKKALEAELKIVSERHFRLVTSNMLDTAAKDLDPVGSQNLAQWRLERQAFNTLSGPPEKLEMVRATVLENPPGAPRPGVYIAVEYRNAYEKVPIECGFFMWSQISEGEFRIVGAGHRYLTREHLAALPPDQAQAAQRQLNCRDN